MYTCFSLVENSLKLKPSPCPQRPYWNLQVEVQGIPQLEPGMKDIKKPIPDIGSVKRKSAQVNGYKIKKPNIGCNDGEDEEELSD